MRSTDEMRNKKFSWSGPSHKSLTLDINEYNIELVAMEYSIDNRERAIIESYYLGGVSIYSLLNQATFFD